MAVVVCVCMWDAKSWYISFFNFPSISSADLHQSAAATEGWTNLKVLIRSCFDRKKMTCSRILIHIRIRILLLAALQGRAPCAACVHSFIRTPGCVYIAQYWLECNKFAALIKIASVILTFMTAAWLDCFQSQLEQTHNELMGKYITAAWQRGGAREGASVGSTPWNLFGHPTLKCCD